MYSEIIKLIQALNSISVGRIFRSELTDKYFLFASHNLKIMSKVFEEIYPLELMIILMDLILSADILLALLESKCNGISDGISISS